MVTEIKGILVVDMATAIDGVKRHYDEHLADFYSWMAGDFAEKQREQESFFREHHLEPTDSGVALDLGAGHGLQTVSLINIGYKQVIAVDFSDPLLQELKKNAMGLPVEVLKGDIREVGKFARYSPELIVCAGDTIAHLPGKRDIAEFISLCSYTLPSGGKLMLSFRDYNMPRYGNDRFIHVKSDDNRIFTCMLEYERERVRVTDLLYTRTINDWQQKVSSYYKVRLTTAFVQGAIYNAGLRMTVHKEVNGMHYIVAVKR